MERKIGSLEKAKIHYKDSWTKALKELINGKFVTTNTGSSNWSTTATVTVTLS